MKRQIKSFEFKVTSVDTAGRTVEGYASVFNNVDWYDDVIHYGSFRKTLVERGGKIRFLWQHWPDQPLGKLIELREDNHGLWFKAVISDTALGRDVLALLKDGAIDGVSIGFDIPKGSVTYEEDDDGNTIRHIHEIKLWEISLVTFPANEAATVDAVKHAHMLLQRQYGDGSPIDRTETEQDSPELKSAVDMLADVTARLEDVLARLGDVLDNTEEQPLGESSGNENEAPDDALEAPAGEEDEQAAAALEEAGPDDLSGDAPPTSEEDTEDVSALLAEVEEALGTIEHELEQEEQ